MPIAEPLETLRAPSASAPRAARWGWFVGPLAVWTVCALLSTAQSAARMPPGRPVAWPALLADRFADWYSCALFTPAYFWLARRVPVTGARWRRGLVVHLAATQLFVVLKYALYVPAGVAIGRRAAEGGLPREVWRAITRNLVYENMAFWAVAAAVHAIVFYREAQARAARAERLRAELTQARLDALAAQLHPHFLFNALNSVSALMHHDVAAADAMLARLGDLLRRTLRAGERPEVTLDEELSLLADYLAVVGTRYRDRLAVRVNADLAVRRALVPQFLLQPIVENAIQHGVARRAGAGTVEVSARRSGAAGEILVLAVADDGPGLRAADPALARGGERQLASAGGIGLTNTRRRLAALYGDRARLVLAERPTGGLCVSIELPFRADAAALDVVGADAPRAPRPALATLGR